MFFIHLVPKFRLIKFIIHYFSLMSRILNTQSIFYIGIKENNITALSILLLLLLLNYYCNETNSVGT